MTTIGSPILLFCLLVSAGFEAAQHVEAAQLCCGCPTPKHIQLAAAVDGLPRAGVAVAAGGSAVAIADGFRPYSLFVSRANAHDSTGGQYSAKIALRNHFAIVLSEPWLLEFQICLRKDYRPPALHGAEPRQRGLPAHLAQTRPLHSNRRSF